MGSWRVGSCSFCGCAVHSNGAYYRTSHTLIHVECHERQLALREQARDARHPVKEVIPNSSEANPLAQ